jgi:hypothetical protein
MTTFVWLCRGASIAFGVLAALKWYKASNAKITTRDNNPHNPGIELRGNADSEEHRPLYTSTAIEQSRLNKTAAIYAIIAALFAALPFFLGP